MKITFAQTKMNTDGEFLLHLEPYNDGDLRLVIEDHDWQGKHTYLSEFNLDKKQLRGFIGALLHIQSKLK